MMDENQKLSEPKSLTISCSNEALIQSALLSAEAAVKQGLAKIELLFHVKQAIHKILFLFMNN